MGPSRQIDRSRARAWALQVLYHWETSGENGTRQEALDNVMSTRRIAPARVPYVRRLMAALDEHGAQIDDQLESALENWRLERLSILDRAILRIASVEMGHFDDVPPKVSIKEAVRLAEGYGGNDSPGFVNGVLDALYRRAKD